MSRTYCVRLSCAVCCFALASDRQDVGLAAAAWHGLRWSKSLAGLHFTSHSWTTERGGCWKWIGKAMFSPQRCSIRERCLHLVMNLNRPKCRPNGTPCCIAAINSAFDLKNASPLFFSLHWWWLTLQHTLQKSPLMHPRERESGRKKQREECVPYVPLTHNTRSCVLMCLLCLLKYLYSSAFLAVPCRVEMQLVFLHRYTRECIMHLFGQTILLSSTEGLKEHI